MVTRGTQDGFHTHLLVRAIMPQPLVNGDLNISISFNGDGWVALAVVVVVVFAFVALSNLKK